MFSFSRNSKSLISNWWWTIDRTLLFCISALLLIGVFLLFTASPAVATRIGYDSFYFVKRQLMFLPIAYGGILFLSMQRMRSIRRFAIIAYIFFMFLLVLTLFMGYETKGASRWIRIFGFSLQASEFVKPVFIILSAWLFDGQMKNKDFPGNILAVVTFGATLGLIIFQPDFSTSFMISVVWIFQFFLSGISMSLILILGGALIVIVTFAYFTFDHVYNRVQQFLDSENNIGYQVKKSLDAFENGFIFGTGPGEGVVKLNIPDSHTDFIFAVAGEEFGIILCMIIIGLILTIIIRSMLISIRENNQFIMLAVSGLAASFGLQSIINIASTTYLIPTTGMTLPLISYGGSSIMATALTMGMLLALTRKNIHAEDKDYEK